MIISQRITELLNLVVEEGSEVTKARCKIERSGCDFIPFADAGKTATNLDNLKAEVVDLYVVVSLIVAEDAFMTGEELAPLIKAKVESLRKWSPNLFKTAPA